MARPRRCAHAVGGRLSRLTGKAAAIATLDLSVLTADALRLAAAAGAEISRLGNSRDLRRKPDGSPVTAADEAAEAILLKGLRKLTPDIPIVAEEQMAGGHQHDLTPDAPFWCVDPLDGTRDFADGFTDYVVCVGLIESSYPVLGVLFAPASGLAWTGANGKAHRINGGTSEEIFARACPAAGPVAFVSRSNRDGAKLDRYLEDAGATEKQTIGSALKFARLAEGAGDLYARFGPTHEWDTAAGQAVLEAAGGAVVNQQGERLRYGKPKFANGPFIARGKI